MGRFLKWLAIGLTLLLLAAAAGLLLALDERPLVERSEVISPNSIVQARHLFAAHDPRRQNSGDIRTVAIPAALIDEGVNYVAGRYMHGRGAFTLAENAGEIRLSVAVPGKRFLNFRSTLQSTNGKLEVSKASLGAMPVPGAAVDFVLTRAVAAYGFGKEWQLAAQAIQNVAVDPASGSVAVTYIWQPSILEHARAAAMQEDDIRHLQAAHSSFAGLVAHRAPGSKVTLAEVLKATFSGAENDTAKRGRAALLVLASYLAGKDLPALVPAARNWPRIRWVNITLAGRHDLAQHFVISAGLAAWAGEPIADAIGMYKELEDARHGSGFSFVDLAADRAGTRFGEALMANPAQLFAAMKNELVDASLLPPVADLPESLHDAEFKRRFGNHQSAAFQAMQEDIERRLDTLSLYQ